MKRLSLLMFLVAFICQMAQAQEISINPVKIYYDLSSPNSTQTQTINITNNSDINQALEIYTGDWIRNEDGSHSYYDAGTRPYSCANWIKVSSNFLSIPPGETERLIITVQAPANKEELNSMKWAMLYLQGSKIKEHIQESGGNLQTKVNEVMRFGVHVYQTPAHLTKPLAKLESLTETPNNAGKYDLLVVNNGDVMVNIQSFLELTNVETGDTFAGEVAECPIFPNGTRKLTLSLPKKLPKGKYSMLGIMDYGNPDALEAVEKIILIE